MLGWNEIQEGYIKVIHMSSFKNRARAAQLIDFQGLQWGKLRPTDIDLSIDWGGKTFVFVEVKGINQGLTVGQRIHLEGLVKAIRAGGKSAHAVLAKHSTRAADDIQAADCLSTSIFSGNNWETVDTNERLSFTLNSLYDTHIEEYGK